MLVWTLDSNVARLCWALSLAYSRFQTNSMKIGYHNAWLALRALLGLLCSAWLGQTALGWVASLAQIELDMALFVWAA